MLLQTCQVFEKVYFEIVDGILTNSDVNLAFDCSGDKVLNYKEYVFCSLFVFSWDNFLPAG